MVLASCFFAISEEQRHVVRCAGVLFARITESYTVHRIYMVIAVYMEVKA